MKLNFKIMVLPHSITDGVTIYELEDGRRHVKIWISHLVIFHNSDGMYACMNVKSVYMCTSHLCICLCKCVNAECHFGLSYRN